MKRSPVFIQNGRVDATAMKRNSLTGSGEASQPRAAGPKNPPFRAWRSSDSATHESTPIRVCSLRIGLLRNGGVGLVAHTFWIAREPSSPLGRKSMNTMKRPKMTMSDHWPPT